jgi:hypothetical protein
MYDTSNNPGGNGRRRHEIDQGTSVKRIRTNVRIGDSCSVDISGIPYLHPSVFNEMIPRVMLTAPSLVSAAPIPSRVSC